MNKKSFKDNSDRKQCNKVNALASHKLECPDNFVFLIHVEVEIFHLYMIGNLCS